MVKTKRKKILILNNFCMTFIKKQPFSLELYVKH